MQIILTKNEKKWAWVIGLTGLVYFISYRLGKMK